MESSGDDAASSFYGDVRWHIGQNRDNIINATRDCKLRHYKRLIYYTADEGILLLMSCNMPEMVSELIWERNAEIRLC